MSAATEVLFLALDQGGHASRALVFSADGSLIASAQIPVTTSAPQPDRVEQDATELVESLRAAIDQVHTALGTQASRVRSAGLATQRSNVVCWERGSGISLSPVLSWQDRRARAWLQQLQCDEAWLHARTGLYPSPHYGASKLRWCLDQLPAVQEAARDGRLVCGPLASYLAHRLLRERPVLIDPANAARTLLWNLPQREWDAGLLALFGVDAALLPASVPTRYAFGTLRWGDSWLPLRVLTGDQSASLFADGRPRRDTLYVNLGTGAFLQRSLEALREAPRGLLASIVYADATRADYVLEATVNGAGSALDWARERLGIRDIDAQLPHWLEREGEIPLFLNGIAGLGSPWWRAGFASRFIGAGEPWTQAVAIVESMVFLIVENLALLQGEAPVARVRVSGGLARLDGLCQRLADVSGLTLLRSTESEATARGVAWLLAEAEGFGWSGAAVDRFAPRSNPACRDRYRRWRDAMHQALSVQ